MRATSWKRSAGRAVPLVVFALAVSGLLVAQVQQQAVDEPYDESVTAQVPAAIPDSAKATPNPFPPSIESLERGGRLYASQCAMCHGTRGAGDGALSKSLRMKMPDFGDRSKRTDGELFYILTNGHGRMPAEGDRLSAEWRWDMVNFVRSLSD